MQSAAFVLVCLVVGSGTALVYLAWRRRGRSPQASSGFVQRYGIRERAVGMLLGGAIGDAKGIAYDGQQYGTFEVTTTAAYQYCPPANTFMPRNFGGGAFTDDTQLSLAVARSIFSAKGFDMAAIVREHIVELDRSTDGWGRTKQCITSLKQGACTWRDSGLAEGLGNGVVMKIAPLAFFYAHSQVSASERSIAVEQFSCLTHRHPVCVVAAQIHCQALEQLFAQQTVSLETLEERYAFLQWLQQMAHKCEARHALVDPKYRLSERLSQLRALSPKEPTSEQLLDIAHGGGYNAVDSLMIVYGVLLKCGLSFEAVLYALSLGGNTDSNCSMLGSIVGGRLGVGAFPREYIEGLLLHKEVMHTGEELGSFLMK